MSKVEKEAEIKRAIEENNKVASKRDNIIRIENEEESYSSSSMSMYSIESNRKGLEVSSQGSPTFREVHILHKHEEVNSSLTTDKNPSERHSKFQEEEEDPSSYNIEKIFEAFTFNIFKKEVSWKRVWNEKKNDGTMKEIQEDEVLFKKTDEDMIIVATTSTTLLQDTTHNVNMLNENISQAKSHNKKLKDEIISLKGEVNKMRKVECDTTTLQASILEQ